MNFRRVGPNQSIERVQIRVSNSPVLAVWLVGFFSPDKETETIQGDLVEEFSRLASSSGVVTARRWYWRQSVTTVAHLLGNGFRAAPWLIGGAVLGGCLLLWFGGDLAEKKMFHFTWVLLHAHGLWIFRGIQVERFMEMGIQVERFLVMMLVGFLVALAVKGREMVTAITLSLVCAALSGLAYPMWTIMHNAELALPVRLFQFESSIAILLGPAIVREIRFILARQHPTA